MGQKIHPIGFRLSVLRNWSSKWYANSKAFPGMLQEDIKVREFLKQKLAHAAVSRIIIERPAKNAKITIFSARPGIVIGKKGEDIGILGNRLVGGLARAMPGPGIHPDQMRTHPGPRSLKRGGVFEAVRRYHAVIRLGGCDQYRRVIGPSADVMVGRV